MDIITLSLAKKYTDKKVVEMATTGFVPTLVDELPTTNISAHTIYLVPAPGAEGQDIYDEYLYVNNKWEKIGTTSVDLTNYYDKKEIDTIIANIELTPGPKGESGVYVGTSEPSSEYDVWIDPTGDSTSVPTKTSELENDSSYTTKEYVDSLMNGVETQLDEIIEGGV